MLPSFVFFLFYFFHIFPSNEDHVVLNYVVKEPKEDHVQAQLVNPHLCDQLARDFSLLLRTLTLNSSSLKITFISFYYLGLVLGLVLDIIFFFQR